MLDTFVAPILPSFKGANFNFFFKLSALSVFWISKSLSIEYHHILLQVGSVNSAGFIISKLAPRLLICFLTHPVFELLCLDPLRLSASLKFPGSDMFKSSVVMRTFRLLLCTTSCHESNSLNPKYGPAFIGRPRCIQRKTNRVSFLGQCGKIWRIVSDFQHFKS